MKRPCLTPRIHARRWSLMLVAVALENHVLVAKDRRRSRHGLPIRRFKRTASKKRRLSVPLRPGSVGLTRQCGSIFALWASVSTNRSIQIMTTKRKWNPDSQQTLIQCELGRRKVSTVFHCLSGRAARASFRISFDNRSSSTRRASTIAPTMADQATIAARRFSAAVSPSASAPR
jgi:hypothetical protein